MGLDIRLPIGLMFGLLGPILLVTGWVQETPLNVQTGAAMTVFAAAMLGMGLWAQRRQRLMSLPSPTQVR
jgi:hypothetical protein